jgi:lysophospholipase L1-like esterase
MLRRTGVSVGLCVVAALAAKPATHAFATGNVYVMGDSIGDGLAVTMGFNNVAQIGIHIRGPKALAQIERVPQGSTVYIFLGTNDAEGSIKNIDKSIADVLDAAAQRNLNVVWVGPHCVRKSWDRQAAQLDQILHDQLAKAGVKYVGMRQDAGICSGKLLEPDGVHPTAKGYRAMWAVIDSTAGPTNTMVASAGDVPTGALAPRPPAAAAPPPAAAAAPAQPPQPAPRVDHRLVMEIHVPGSPSEPLVWTRSQN